MNTVKRLKDLKTWAAGNLEYENAGNIIHDLNAVIEVVIKLNKKADMHEKLLKLLGEATIRLGYYKDLCRDHKIATLDQEVEAHWKLEQGRIEVLVTKLRGLSKELET